MAMSADDFKAVYLAALKDPEIKKELGIDDLKKKVDDIESTLLAKGTEISKLQHDTSVNDKSVKALKNRVSTLEADVEEFEQYKRRNNLRISGISEEENEDIFKKLKDLCNDKLDCDIVDEDIIQVKRMGKPGKPNRQVLVEFSSLRIQQKVFAAKKKLKPVTNTTQSIWLNEDLSPKRSQILYSARNAKRQGLLEDCWSYRGVILVKTKHTKQIRRIQSMDELQTITGMGTEVSESSGTKVLEDGSILFFTKKSMLSNFYPCEFGLDTKEYNCAEQAIQRHRALLANDMQSAQTILDMIVPKDMKSRGDSLKLNVRKWHQNAPAILDKVLYEKFTQSEELQNYLINTKEVQLYEASPCETFGIGMHIDDKNIRDKTKWHTDFRNLTGEALMRLRTTLVA